MPPKNLVNDHNIPVEEGNGVALTDEVVGVIQEAMHVDLRLKLTPLAQ